MFLILALFFVATVACAPWTDTKSDDRNGNYISSYGKDTLAKDFFRNAADLEFNYNDVTGSSLDGMKYDVNYADEDVYQTARQFRGDVPPVIASMVG